MSFLQHIFLCCAAFGLAHPQHNAEGTAGAEVRLGIVGQSKIVTLYDPSAATQDHSEVSSETARAAERRLLSQFANIGGAGEPHFDNAANGGPAGADTGTFEDVYGLSSPRDGAHRPSGSNSSGAMSATKSSSHGADLYGRSQLM